MTDAEKLKNAMEWAESNDIRTFGYVKVLAARIRVLESGVQSCEGDGGCRASHV